MGLLARLFGRDADSRIAKARSMLDARAFADARWEVDGLEGAQADELRTRALEGLVELNVEEARARFSAGDATGGQEHLDLAREYGATPQQLRDVRRHARTLRAEKEAADAAAQASEAPAIEGDDPLWQLPPDDPRLRYALLLETWPDDLRVRLVALGADFAQAVLLLEDGQPAQARAMLDAWVEKDPVVRYERARACLALGQLAAVASDLSAFADAFGHRRIGSFDTAIVLAQVLSQLGRADEALTTLNAELTVRPEPSLAATRAGVLEALGRLPEAESTAEKVLHTVPRDMGLYRLLARIRVKLGKRLAAMQALEGGLATCCSSPGKCGNQAFDVDAGRLLARLYLEDRMEPRRVEELLAELSRNVAEPSWDDRYLSALMARNKGDPDASTLAARLVSDLNPADPRRRVVETAFPPA